MNLTKRDPLKNCFGTRLENNSRLHAPKCLVLIHLSPLPPQIKADCLGHIDCSHQFAVARDASSAFYFDFQVDKGLLDCKYSSLIKSSTIGK